MQDNKVNAPPSNLIYITLQVYIVLAISVALLDFTNILQVRHKQTCDGASMHDVVMSLLLPYKVANML